MPPTIILVRHAEALHNVDNKSQDYTIPDPELSERGRAQCLELRENLRTKLPGMGLEVGLILVSPMRRTIETALRSLDFLLEKGVPIQAHAGWQENSAKPCDTGSSLAALRAEFPAVDFSRVDPVYPDKTSPAGAHYWYTRKAIVGRAQAALADLHARPADRAVLVVSHSGFLRQGVTGRWFFNADYRVFDFAAARETGDRDDSGGPPPPYDLVQWDATREGGLGWSWTETVRIGDDLPEQDVYLPEE